MSLARWSNAYWNSQSTRWTMWWSFASSVRPALPSSTSCSNLRRVGEHALDGEAQHLRELALPARHQRLAGGDGDFLAAHLHRQDAAALRVLRAHHLGDGLQVDLERVDVVVGQLAAHRQPLREALQLRRLVGARVAHARLDDRHQRVAVALGVARFVEDLLGVFLAGQAVLDQPVEHLAQGELAVDGSLGGRSGGHGGHYS
jgi:hypothetical protein